MSTNNPFNLKVRSKRLLIKTKKDVVPTQLP